MAVRIEKTSTIIIGFDGKKENKEDTLVTARCDGPKCHEKDAACRGELSWSEADPDNIPDDAWRLLVLSGFTDNSKSVFFSRECLRDYMRSYSPPLSPKEAAKIEENNKKYEKDTPSSDSDVIVSNDRS